MLATFYDLEALEGNTLKISCQRQDQCNAALVQLFIHVPPRSNKDDSFCGIAPWRMEYGICVFSAIAPSPSLVLILLCGHFQAS